MRFTHNTTAAHKGRTSSIKYSGKYWIRIFFTATAAGVVSLTRIPSSINAKTKCKTRAKHSQRANKRSAFWVSSLRDSATRSIISERPQTNATAMKSTTTTGLCHHKRAFCRANNAPSTICNATATIRPIAIHIRVLFQLRTSAIKQINDTTTNAVKAIMSQVKGEAGLGVKIIASIFHGDPRSAIIATPAPHPPASAIT